MKTLEQYLTKYPLLALDSPRYIKRLVRELSYRSAGFYCNGSRYNQARFSKGQLQARMGFNSWDNIEPTATFGDGNGGIISASRDSK